MASAKHKTKHRTAIIRPRSVVAVCPHCGYELYEARAWETYEYTRSLYAPCSATVTCTEENCGKRVRLPSKSVIDGIFNKGVRPASRQT